MSDIGACFEASTSSWSAADSEDGRIRLRRNANPSFCRCTLWTL